MKIKSILVMVFLIVFVGVTKADTFDEVKNDLKKACSGGNFSSCELLAVDLYKRICDSGVAVGCFSLGESYEKGWGVSQNIQKALELYRKSCDMREQRGCDAYAELKNKG